MALLSSDLRGGGAPRQRSCSSLERRRSEAGGGSRVRRTLVKSDLRALDFDLGFQDLESFGITSDTMIILEKGKISVYLSSRDYISI